MTLTLKHISDTLSQLGVMHLATDYHVMTNNPVIVWECLNDVIMLVSVQEHAPNDVLHRALTEILSTVHAVSIKQAEELIQRVKDDRR